MGKNGKSLTYDQQCLIAIARALPTDDVYHKTIQDEIETGSGLSLVEFTGPDPEVPVFCGCGQTESVDLPMTLVNLMEYGDRSGIARVYARFHELYSPGKPRAMFIRTDKPAVINLVLHSLTAFRTHWDYDTVIHMLRPRGQPLFVERRTTFCELFARIGPWARDREGYTLPINWSDSDGDLRKLGSGQRLAAARSLATEWGYHRRWSKVFKGRDDSDFVEVVMEMQMQKAVEAMHAKR